jgi:hypothetical protein
MASPWVLTKELPYALHQKLRIIPILLENCNIPPQIQGVRYVDFTKSWDFGFVELARALPRSDYDEVEYLRTALQAIRLGRDKQRVLSWLKEISAQEQDWTVREANDVMLKLQGLPTTKGSLNDIYWWLINHGVFTFKGIESEDMCNAEEFWSDSVSCALLTARGVALLNNLHLEVITQRAMETATRAARSDGPALTNPR